MAAVIKRRILPNSASAVNVDELPSDMPDLLRRIFHARGLHSSADVDLSMSGLLPPAQLAGMEAATELLVGAIQQQARILVVGDYDADGATSSALALRAMARFGHSDVSFLVPNRFEYGYGLSPEIVELAKHQKPALIVTVDNGISSIEGVQAARDLGIDVLITDHHLPGRELPAANAIVNPNQHGCKFPSKMLAGVGVIFYVMLALRARLDELGWFSDARPKPNMAEFLDLVALGTVADVVPLDRNNRILVEQGLRRIRRGQACAGILAIIECAGRSRAGLTASDLGFAVGPRLNAAGRLDDISIGIGCLLTDDANLAREMASELDGLNRDRQQIEKSMQVLATQQLARIQLDFDAQQDKNSADNDFPVGICLQDDEWHQGVVGILASRIKEQYHRPVVCFALANDDPDCGMLKGSARSIPGFHIRDALDAIATANPGLIEKFGGHAMAAGLSLERADFKVFAAEFNRQACEHLEEQDLQAVVLTDGMLQASEITLPNAHLLRSALPWGQKLPEPLFDGEFFVVNQRIVGERHLKLVLSQLLPEENVAGNNKSTAENFDAIAFNIDPADWPDSAIKSIKIGYLLDVNAYRGRETVQFIVRHIEKVY